MVKKLLIVIVICVSIYGSAFSQVKEHGVMYTTELLTSDQTVAELKNKIEVYPNPSVEFIIVEISNSDLEKVKFQLHSLIGNTVDVPYEEVGKNKYKINLQEYTPGYYFLIIKDDVTYFKEAYKFLKN
ncbi:MAG: T9SS type A sorting domain-containing protein [Reichenbachiella sp.]